VVLQSMSLHATEIGGSQMAPELIYDLASRNDEETQRILDNVIAIMIPSFNPDGQIMVTDWYRKTLGTEYEGSNYPSLYHKYVGHDNNRDAFQTNMVESQYMAKLLFREWIPQAYVDHHHMGSYGARIFLPAGEASFDGTGYHNSGFLGLPPEIGQAFGLHGDSYDLTFTKAGEYPYYCILHASGPDDEYGMTGKVIVQ